MTQPLNGEFSTVHIAGVAIASITEDQVVGHVVDCAAAGAGGWVVTSNTDHLRLCSESSQIRALVAEADLAVADGMPLVWASRLLGSALPERIAGSSLIWTLTAGAAEAGLSVYFLGGEGDVAVDAAHRLRLAYPRLRVAGAHVPPFGFEHDAAEMQKIRDKLVAASPDIVFVALGFPKQERLIRQLRSELPSAWFLGVGISFSYVAGSVPRAPAWMRSAGLEWVHRLAHDPERLWDRYVRRDIPFALRLLRTAAVERLRQRRRSQ